MNRKTKIVLVQLGSPASPEIRDVRAYLKEFLGDPRVVDINPYLWKVILNLFVLPLRPKRSARLYQRIWTGSSFPLIENTARFAHKMNQYLLSDSLEVDYVFLLSPPRIRDLWDQWEAQLEKQENAADKWYIVPLFPQYSESTTASVLDQFYEELKKRTRIPAFEVLPFFHHSRPFIDHSVGQIENYLQKRIKEGAAFDKLVISFHGIPKRRVLYKKDPYYRHCFETYHFLQKEIKEFSSEDILMTFQSRFGSEEWLTPYTEDVVLELIAQGEKRILVYCPSFVADCLETIDEIGHELAHTAEKAGGTLELVPCLNDEEEWSKDFAQFLVTQIQETQQKTHESFYLIDKESKHNMPEQKMNAPPLTVEAKTSLKIVFLTLFLDLVSFSIIFPLFPALAAHYVEKDPNDFFLKAILSTIASWTSAGGSAGVSEIVLFGGILGALYSFLQFLAAPFWGMLSDKIGRRPVLLISLTGLALSYLLWFFSGSFTLLILARFIGGIMGGNISTATAVVADVTQRENRSRGMAIIGIAFALGFILGPAIGGISSLFDFTKTFPALEAYGVNPFSTPALIAFLLTCFNIVWLFRKFKETLPEEHRGKALTDRSANPLLLFRPLPFKGTNLTNFGHFLFLMAFSGMEFTLTFLAVERLEYDSMKNAYMFIFIGFLIAFVQGGIVRRKAAQVGEKKMAIMGLCTLIPGLLLIGLAQSSLLLYAGLFFLAVGSSMAIPCLTTLVSLYTPPEHQGKAIGVFRSLGALARVLGPMTAAIIYWRLGSEWPYFAGAVFLLIPILMISALPLPPKEHVSME